MCTSNDIHRLAEFFAARLHDWPAIHGALLGCLSLLRRTSTIVPNLQLDLTAPDISLIVDSLVKWVYVRSLTAKDRALALSILHTAIEQAKGVLLDSDVDLLEYTIASIDGEKDPRCLLEGFSVVQALLELYKQQPEASIHVGKLEDATEELFDVLSCYFPVSFTPPPNDPHGITRNGIASALEATLVAYQGFASRCVSLALDKLASIVRQAKLDSLHLLEAAAISFGAQPLEEHVPGIWAALRRELMAPAEDGQMGPEAAASEELAVAAAGCLTRCVEIFSSSQGNVTPFLPALVLADSSVQDLLAQCAAPANPADEAAPASSHFFRRSISQSKSTCRMLGALGQAGGAASHQMSDRILSKLVYFAEEQQQRRDGRENVRDDDVAFLVQQEIMWSSIATLTQSIGQGFSSMAPVATTPANPPPILKEDLLRRIVLLATSTWLSHEIITTRPAAQPGLSSLTVDPGNDSKEHDEYEYTVWTTDPALCSPSGITWIQLLNLETIFSSEALGGRVSIDDASRVGDILLSTAIQCQERAVRSQATSSLRALVSGKAHGAVLSQTVLPKLLKYATETPIESPESVAPEAGYRSYRSSALAAVRQIATSTPSILRDTIIGLDHSIQVNLSHYFKDGSASTAAATAASSDRLELVQDLLLCLDHLMAQVEAKIATDEVMAAHGDGVRAMLGQLAHNLLDCVLLLPRSQSHQDLIEGKDESSSRQILGKNLLEPSMARVVYDATRLSTTAAQQQLANAATESTNALYALLPDYEQSMSDIASLQLAVCSSVIIGLRQGVPSGPLGGGEPSIAPSVVESLVGLALSPNFLSARTYLAKAAASLLNKFSQSEDTVAAGTTIDRAFEAIASGNPAQEAAGWSVLAEVARGLAMRNSQFVEHIVHTAAAALILRRNSSTEQCSSIDRAASFFGFLLTENGDMNFLLCDEYKINNQEKTKIAFNRTSHALVKPLWQQRTYTLASSALVAPKPLPLPLPVEPMESDQTNFGGLFSPTGQKRQMENREILALAYLLTGAPAAVLRNDTARVVQWLTLCLSELGHHGGDGHGSQDTTAALITSLLFAMSDALGTERGKAEAQSLIANLVPALVDLSDYRPRASVRVSAVKALERLLQLPYATVHPYKKKILKAVVAATDDNKRSVRAAAATCREAWQLT